MEGGGAFFSVNLGPVLRFIGWGDSALSGGFDSIKLFINDYVSCQVPKLHKTAKNMIK